MLLRPTGNRSDQFIWFVFKCPFVGFVVARRERVVQHYFFKFFIIFFSLFVVHVIVLHILRIFTIQKFENWC